jgi:hypothetical protein
LLGKLDGKSELSLNLHDRAGQSATTIRVLQNGSRVTVQCPLPGFELQLPWATFVKQLVGGKSIEKDDPTQARAPVTDRGVLIVATAEEVQFEWAL